MSAMEQRVELTKAALREFGRPDLADAVKLTGSRAQATKPATTEDMQAYYKAIVIAQRFAGKPILCFDCWRSYALDGAEWPDCEHA